MKTTFISTILAVVSALGVVQAIGEPDIHRELRRGRPSCERLTSGDDSRGADANAVFTFIGEQIETGGTLENNVVATAAYDKMSKMKEFKDCMLNQCIDNETLESPDPAQCRQDEQTRRGLRRHGGPGNRGSFFGPPDDEFDCETDIDDAQTFISVIEDEFGDNGGDNRAARMVILKVEMRMLWCD